MPSNKKLLAYALSFSSTLAGLTFFLFYLVEHDVIEDWHAFLILVLVVIQFVYYAIVTKNKR